MKTREDKRMVKIGFFFFFFFSSKLPNVGIKLEKNQHTYYTS